MKDKISVVLCTYNGEKYITEQLQSIIHQTVPPDEIIICDDRSSDHTIALLDPFLNKDAGPVIQLFHNNNSQLRHVKNFEKGIRLATGDIIFLSDQDDVWDNRKIEVFLQEFEKNKDAGLLFSNADVVDADLNTLRYTLWDYVGFTVNEFDDLSTQQLLKHLMENPKVTGAALAFKTEFKDKLLPFSSYIGHDEWLALGFVLFSKIKPINLSLVKYRQHGGNQIGAVKKQANSSQSAKSMKREALAFYYSFYLKKLKGFIQFVEHANQMGIPLSKEVLSDTCNRAMHYRNRWKASGSGLSGYSLLIKELWKFRYFKYSDGLKGFISDLIHS